MSDSRRNQKQTHALLPSLRLASIRKLALTLDLDGAEAAAEFVKDAPLELPEGAYRLSLSGDTVHVRRIGTEGIRKYDFTDRAKGGQVELCPEGVGLSYDSTDIRRILLHTSPLPQAEAESAPSIKPSEIKAIEEIRDLSALSAAPGSAQNKRKMADLLRRIQLKLNQPDIPEKPPPPVKPRPDEQASAPPPRRAPTYSPPPPAPSYSSESSSYRSTRSYGGG